MWFLRCGGCRGGALLVGLGQRGRGPLGTRLSLPKLATAGGGRRRTAELFVSGSGREGGREAGSGGSIGTARPLAAYAPAY